LTLDLDVTQFGIDSGNIWYLKDEEMDEHFEQLMKNDIAEGIDFPASFISCTTLKDPTSFNGRYHNFEVVTFINYNSFKEFNDLEEYHTEQYAKVKERVVQKLLNTIEKIIPGAKNNVVQAELGTPKTNQFYINATNGNVYGTEKTLNQVGPFSFKNKSEIENLFLCGASTLSHGVGGATHSGVAAAAAILNRTPDQVLKEDPTQHLRIYDAEDQTTWPSWIHTKRADKVRNFKQPKEV